MAKFNVVGLDDVQEAMLRQDAIVEEAVPEMLKVSSMNHLLPQTLFYRARPFSNSGKAPFEPCANASACPVY